MGTHRFTEPEEVHGKQHYLKHCLASMERETSGRLGGMVLQADDWIKKQKSISFSSEITKLGHQQWQRLGLERPDWVRSLVKILLCEEEDGES